MWWCIEHHTCVFCSPTYRHPLTNHRIAHPFLLADNRHYAFYIWRRVINPHPLMRYALAPGYLFAARLLWDRLGASATALYVSAANLASRQCSPTRSLPFRSSSPSSRSQRR